MMSKFELQHRNILKHEPEVRALVPGTYNPEQLRLYLKNNSIDLPLSGLTMVLKDIINADGFPTQCGAAVRPDEFTGKEASCVTRLKEMGAVVLAKATTVEFSAYKPARTRNPCNTAYSPGGSSSGSAAAVAAEYCDFAIGSQTGGSTIRPAAYCGVVGFKPTFGTIPLDGFFPYSPSMDHIGLFARDVSTIEKIMAALKNVTVGPAKGLDATRFQFGIPDDAFLDACAHEAREHFEICLQELARNGLQVHRVCGPRSAAGQAAELHQLAEAEFCHTNARLLERYASSYSALLGNALRRNRGVTAEDIRAMREKAAQRKTEMVRFMEDHNIDFWLCPSAPDTAPESLNHTGSDCMNAIWSYVHLPAITVPTVKNDNNLPYGLQMVGRHGQDEHLLAVAGFVSNTLSRQFTYD